MLNRRSSGNRLKDHVGSGAEVGACVSREQLAAIGKKLLHYAATGIDRERRRAIEKIGLAKILSVRHATLDARTLISDCHRCS